MKRLPVLTNASPNTKPKTVMPEVLPKPERASSSTPTNNPRTRTVAHMQRLLATAAAVAVAGTGTISCGKEAKSTGTERQGCGSKAKALDAGNPDVPPTGYAVVDPMPTPAYCPGLAPLIHPTAKLIPQPNGAVHLVVTMSAAKGRDDFKYVKDAPVVAYAATVVSSEIKPDGSITVTAKLDPGVADAGTASISISVKGTCNQGPATLSASVSWQDATTRATPSVYVNEY